MRTWQLIPKEEYYAAACERLPLVALAASLIAILAAPVAAQESAGDVHAAAFPAATAEESPEAVTRGARLQGFGLWLAHAGSTVDASYGHAPGWSLSMAGARANWLLGQADRLTVSYTMDLIPAAMLSSPDDGRPAVCGRGRTCLPSATPAYGLGLSPVGIHVGYRAHRAIRIHGGFTAGGMWFTERIPVTTASRTNFAVDLGTGVTFVRQGGMGVTLGYRIHHLSNGWTAQANPGIGAHLLTLGIHWDRE